MKRNEQLPTILVCAFLIAGCAEAAYPSSPTTDFPDLPSKTLASSPFRTESRPADADSTETRYAVAPDILLTPTETVMITSSPETLTITILYNNIASDTRLQTDWGFSALVEYRNETLLFDTGGNGSILLRNMQAMGADPLRIEDVVLSHAHNDHTGGLPALLDAAARPPVYLLSEFGTSFIQSVKKRTEVVEVIPGMEISPGMRTTGNAGGGIPEQALVVETPKGLVIITGCAHPGIVRIVERAVELTGKPVHLVLGGFHLRDMSDAQIAAILRDFRRLGVEEVAPSHCTGERAMAMFAEEYGVDFLRTGAGSILRLDG